MSSLLASACADHGSRPDDVRTDAELLRAFVEQKSEAAFEAVVHRYGAMVFGVCRRLLGNEHDAADAFQAVFLVLARKAASIRSREVLGAWLYNVAYRTSQKARAVGWKRKTREQQVSLMPEPALESDVVADDDVLALLDEEVRALPAKYQMPVILCELQGFTRKEAAAKLNLAEGTLSSRLAMARKKLADRLRRRCVALTATALGVILAENLAQAAAPAPLIAATAQAAAPAAAGHALTGLVSTKIVSANAAALCEGVVQSMVFANLQFILLVVAAPWLLASALHFGLTLVEPPSDDPAAALATLKNLGAKFRWEITPTGKQMVAVDLKRTKVQDEHLRLLPIFKELREVVLTDTAVGDAGLTELGKLEKLKRLLLSGTRVSDAGVKALAGNKELRTLELARTQVSGGGFADLADLTELRELDLRHTAMSDAGLKNLAPFQKLQNLELRKTRVTDGGLKELAAFPDLRLLRLEETMVTDAGVKDILVCSRLNSLSLEGDRGVTDAAIKDLVSLPNLNALSAAGTKVTDACVADLAQCKSLHWLALDRTALTGKGLQSLAPLKLTTLLLSGSKVTDAALKEIAALTSLESLHFDNTGLSDAGIKEITTLRRLGALALQGTHVSDACVDDLAAFKELWLLNVSSTKITDAGIKKIATFPKLHWLAIHGTAVTDAGLKDLTANKAIDTLWISWTKITQAGLRELPQFGNLNTLRLGGLPVSDADLKVIAQLRNLHTLWLDFTSITDAGLKELAPLTRLQELYLNGTAVTDAGLRELAACKGLQRVEVQQTKVTDAGVKELKATIGHVAVNNQQTWDGSTTGGKGRAFWWLAAVVLVLTVGGGMAWILVKRKSIVTALLVLSALGAATFVGQRVFSAARSMALVSSEPSSKVRLLKGHTGPVRAVKFTPDGKKLVSISGWPGRDNSVRIWDLTTDQELARIPAPGAVAALEMTPDGRFALAGAMGGLLVIDMESGGLVRLMRLPRESFPGLALSADGQHAYSATFDGIVRRWNWREGKEVGRVKVAGSKGRGVVELPDGRVLTVDTAGILQIWDFATGTELKRIDTGIRWVCAMTLAPGGKEVLVSGWHADLWDLETGRKLRTFRGHTSDLNQMSFSPDGQKLLTVSFDGSARLWDFEKAELLQVLTTQEEWLSTGVYSPVGRLIVLGGGGAKEGQSFVGGSDHVIRIFEMPEELAAEESGRAIWYWAAGIAGAAALLSMAGLIVLRRRRRDLDPEVSSEPASSVAFSCSHCGKRLRAKRELVGKQVKCPQCDERTQVPGPETA